MIAESWTIWWKVGKENWRRPKGFLLALKLSCVLLPLGYFWGFSVDDAWIVSRVARCIQTTGTAAFNFNNPRSEAITPFGFAESIALIGSLLKLNSSEELFQLARLGGVTAWLASIAFAYRLLLKQRRDPRSQFFFFALIFLCVPGAAWASAGLSGPYCGLFFIFAEWAKRKNSLSLELVSRSVVLAFRPELLPFLIVQSGLSGATLQRRIFMPLILLSNFLLIALIRLHLSGTPLPLAFYAKTPSVDSGLAYAWGSLWFATPFLAILLQKRIYSPQAHRFGWALLLFLASLVFAGGDWMPLFRLLAPLFPLACLYGALYCNQRNFSLLTLVPSALAAAVLIGSIGSNSRLVLKRRWELVRLAVPALSDAKRIAAVDIGWVGQASNAEIFDLAGVTEPKVAKLPGGHTSKWVTPAMVEAQQIDTWVIRLATPLGQARESVSKIHAFYEVDKRLLKTELSQEFQFIASLPLEGLPGGYAILKKKPLPQN